MNLTQNITKESDPVRQKHYTTKKHWLVDFINIFWFILKLFLFRQQIPYFCWYYLYWAAHNGSNYLNGHCFVRVMLCVPVWNGDKVSHLSVPLGYRMWQKKESKLELAASMIRQVMPEFHSKDHVIIPCDSWYTKQNLVSIVDEYPNPDLIGNARSDSVMYDLTYVYFFVCKISENILVKW